jgi:hypothetical protein
MSDTTVIPPTSVPSVTSTPGAVLKGPESWSDTQKMLALFYSVAFIIVIVLLFFVSPKADPQIFTLLTALVGALSTNASNIVQYYFGTSKASTGKDATILAQATAAAQPPANGATKP